MERTQIYLTPEQKEALLVLSNEKATPMAELIRKAIDDFLVRYRRNDRKQVLQETFGVLPEWKEGGETYTRRLRSGWQERPHAAEEGEPYCPT